MPANLSVERQLVLTTAGIELYQDLDAQGLIYVDPSTAHYLSPEYTIDGQDPPDFLGDLVEATDSEVQENYRDELLCLKGAISYMVFLAEADKQEPAEDMQNG